MVLGGDGGELVSVTAYLRDLAIGGCSRSTCRSYAYDLLRWFRLLSWLERPLMEASEREASAFVGWMRSAANPQRRRANPSSPSAGSVNARTGKPYLGAGYAPSTINHAVTVVSGFYAFHRHRDGAGPQPVPSQMRREALAHRSRLDPVPVVRRGRLRQRVPQTAPRAIPDGMWREFFDALTCDRDRAAILLYVSSGARASELLAVTPGDIDWPRQLFYVVSKGTRVREIVPASPQALAVLAAYLEHAGLPAVDAPVFRTRRGPERPLTYWAMRRVVQRANERLGTNWSLHDLRHTAATRMANDPALTLAQVRVLMRHADLATTSRYVRPRVEELFDALQQHYERPLVAEPALPPGYDPADVAAVFGA